MLPELFLEGVAWLLAGAEGDKGHDPLPLDLVGTANDRSFGNGGMTDQGTLDLGGSEAVTGDVEHVIDTADDPEVSLLVTTRSVPREVGTFDLAPILLAVTLLVTPDTAEHRGPRFADDEFATLSMRNLLAVVVDNGGIHPEERERGRPGLAGCGSGKRSDHVRAGLGLPPGVDDRAAFVSDIPVKPHPGLGIDRFPNGAEKSQRGKVMLFEMLVTPLHEGADGRRGGVKDRDPVLGDQLPETVRLGPVRGPFVHEAGGAVGKRSVDEIAVTGDPADVGRAPVDILLPEVEDILGRGIRSHQIAARGVEDPLRLSGRAAGVENEEGMLAVEGLRSTICRDILEFPVPPDIAARFDVDLEVRAPEDNHATHGIVALERMIDVLLERHDLPAAVTAVSGDDHLGPAVGKTILDALRAEAAEDDRVDRPDAGAGQHGDGGLGDKGHVDEDPVPLLHAVTLEDIGKPADLPVELAVGQDTLLAGFTFPDDCGLVRAWTVEMAVEAVL